MYDSEVGPSSGSCNLFPHIYTLRKRIKGHHRSRSARFSKATISLTLCDFFFPRSLPLASRADDGYGFFRPDASSFRQLLLQGARSSSLDRIPSASCRVVWWSRVRGYVIYRHFSFIAGGRQRYQRYSTPRSILRRSTPFSSSSSGPIKQWHAGIRR